jgi:uncharacterized protein (TIGR00297 family)
VQPRLRRAGGFALVSTLALAAPVLGPVVAVPFALVAAVAYATTEGRLFRVFARPADRREGRLFGLASFALASAGVALLVPLFGMPPGSFVATVLLVGYGNLAAVAIREWRPSELAATTAFVGVGAVAAAVGEIAAALLLATGVAPPRVLFLSASGALLAALLRAMFTPHDDPLVLLVVALLLWLFATLVVTVAWQTILVALGVTVLFGYLSWALDAASIPGMLTGVLLALLTVVLGGYGWFAVLIAFFALGALATKFRYESKLDRGVAEARGGARGTGNVLGNSAAALAALLLYAAGGHLPVSESVFAYAFAGSVATALADTLSSEVGGLYDNVRLVTTLQRVPPGTDGGITWQGELAGLAGAAIIAALAASLPGIPVTPVGALPVVAAGFAGMTADSLLGAAIEGGYVGNQTVNFLATLTGGVAGGFLALLL